MYRKINGFSSIGSTIGLSLIVVGLTVITLVASGQSFAQTNDATFSEGQVGKIKGLILARNGEGMRVRDEHGKVYTIVLTDYTKITSPKGMLKLRKQERGVTTLLPGLRVEVEGTGNAQGQVLANKVTFNSDDLATAQQISAGQYQLDEQQKKTQAQVTENKEGIDMLNKRLSDTDDYETRGVVTITFPTGSSALTAEGRKSLDDLMTKGQGAKNYMVEVTGYADTTGNEARNKELSQRRAETVVTYLAENDRVPLRRILTPTGKGESKPVASNTSAEGRAQNRRVEVKVLINKGLSQQ